ncbi:MAG: hypothetical protein B7Z02_09580 [Rhodobacterales bacterium 32-67-9]|nr:MAG: hypothetical protein B7Z02_09580 [Rhodobacterales bacterium 32-67-9]
MPGLEQPMTGAGTWSLLSGPTPPAVRLVYAEAHAALGRVEPLDAENRTAGETGFAGLLARVPCFTPSTRIATERGECPVEALRPGDRVVTRDNGVQPVLWAGGSAYGWRDLGLLPVLRPVLIRAGALGDGLPLRDLLLSPNHRILVRSMSDTGVATGESLVAAHGLVGRPGIEVVAPAAVTYLQLLFARHEAVLADGVWSESFHVGPATLSAMPGAARDAVRAVLPELGRAEAPPLAPVRPEISKHEIGALHC